MVYRCTYRKHFEDLQPVGSPALLGFVDRQRKMNVSGILRKEQHQEDSPADRNNLPSDKCVFISCAVYSPLRKLILHKHVLFKCLLTSGWGPWGFRDNQLSKLPEKSVAITGTYRLSLWSGRGAPSGHCINSRDTAAGADVTTPEYPQYEVCLH